MTGTDNVAIGFDALLNNTIGSGNVALGALPVPISLQAIAISYRHLVLLARPIPCASAQSRRATFISGIIGGDTATPVVVNSRWPTRRDVSSRRFKKEIKPMDKASEAILALKPVTFHYKNDIEPIASRNLG